ncbi:MAG: lipase family protein [Rhodopila sp.]|nr:lipase family protein [Rhodopila sp.]
MQFTDSTVVPYGLLVMYSMDIYRQKTCPPAPFTMPPAPTGGGVIIGFVMGTDSIVPGHPNAGPGPLGDLSEPVCYGTVIRRGLTEVVVALRGTDGYMEWIEDGQFPLIPYAPAHPLPPGAQGLSVEQGFWGIYHSLVLIDVHGTLIGPLAQTLPTILGANDTVVVAGHSLGAPLATYLTLDLARGPLGQRVSGCYFASPHPGNQAFATLFDQVVGNNYVVYNYLLDVVPRVPPIEFGYCSLSGRRVIQPDTAQADISFGIGCNHHIICYLAMLDYAATKPYITSPPAGEEGSATCIRGPQTGQPTLAKSLVNRIVEVAA